MHSTILVNFVCWDFVCEYVRYLTAAAVWLSGLVLSLGCIKHQNAELDDCGHTRLLVLWRCILILDLSFLNLRGFITPFFLVKLIKASFLE